METFGNIFIAKNAFEQEMEKLQQLMIIEGSSKEGLWKESNLKLKIEEHCKQE